MTAKLLLALAAFPTLLSNATPTDRPATANDITFPDPYRGSFDAVPKISCQSGSGSGVRISDDIIITARHVIEGNGPCGAFDAPVNVVHLGDQMDFAAVRGKFGPGYRAVVSCEGIRPGERYYAFGYAHGGAPNVERLVGTNQRLPGNRVVMRGRVFPGMSGGKVTNDEGAFVAITVQYDRERDTAILVDLKGTYLCA